jgi:UDP-2,3-diacylglucosamine hydrolase
MTNVEKITHLPAKKVYFVSDFHLGLNVGANNNSRAREKRIIQWLDEISKDAQTIFFLGDIFDFWFEYKHVVPKGYVRFLGKLAELSDNGIDLRLFVGNHDFGTFGYLENEIGMKIYRKPQLIKINESLCFIGHGNGLGPAPWRTKLEKKVFENRFCQRLFAFLHPWIGIGFANFSSRKNRQISGYKDNHFISEDKESLLVFSKEYLQKNPNVNYFIFGHRHLPQEFKISENTTYFNTGDWLKYDSFLELSKDMKIVKRQKG